jgi:hypothetical protein
VDPFLQLLALAWAVLVAGAVLAEPAGRRLAAAQLLLVVSVSVMAGLLWSPEFRAAAWGP